MKQYSPNKPVFSRFFSYLGELRVGPAIVLFTSTALVFSVVVAVFDLTTTVLYVAILPITCSALVHRRRSVYLTTSIIVLAATMAAVWVVSLDVAESIKTVTWSSICVIPLNEMLFSLTAGRERALASEREATRLLQTTLNSIPDVIGIQGLNHEIISYNKAGYDFLGLTPEEVHGKKCFELIDRGMPCDVCATEIVYKTKQPAKVERYEPSLDRWLDARTYPVLDDDGNIIRLIEHLRDITDIKTAEKALIKSEKFLEDVFDAIRDGIVVLDGDLSIIRVNSWMESFFSGQMPLVGKKCYEIFNCKGTPKPDCPSTRALETGIPESEVFQVDSTSSGAVWLEISSFPLEDSNGKIIGVIEYIKDITVRANAEADNAELQEQLLQSQKMEAIGRLAGGIAHDFNNMLTAIKGNAELLTTSLNKIEGEQVPQEFRSYMDELVAASDRAQSLTAQLLTFSRKQVVQPEVVNLRNLLSEIRPMLRRIIGEDIEVVTRVSTSKGHVFADSGQLQQIVLNLTVNARDAMPAGGTITFAVDEPGSYPDYQSGLWISGHSVVLSVTDNGTGFSDEVKKHLFEPFYTTKDVGKGTGLGLATVYGIVEQLGGVIAVESEPGRGATFRICLPIAPEMGKEAVPSADTLRGGELSGTETILLAEDEDLVNNLINRVLTQYGYTVLTANSAARAIEIMDTYTGPVDLLLTDMVMPGMGGAELADRLQQRYPQLKALFISGYAKDARNAETETGVAASFIQKPFTPESLASHVRRMLDGK